MLQPHLQPPTGRAWRAAALALAVQSIAFWLVLAALGFGVVPVRWWIGLHGGLALTLAALVTRVLPSAMHAGWMPGRTRTWLALAFYAAFLSAFFAGANVALDALHGAERRRPDIASHLGGLALWQLLCPGVFSLALGAAANAWLQRDAGVNRATANPVLPVSDPAPGCRTPAEPRQ